MTPRFPESAHERAARLTGMVRRLGGGAAANLESTASSGLPSPSVLQKRIAQRLAAAASDTPRAMIDALATAKAEAGHALAARLIHREVGIEELPDESLANLEAVIRVADRPAWFVRKDVPQTEAGSSAGENEFWVVLISNAGRALSQACGRIGCLMKQDSGGRTPVGTAWVIGPRTIATNAHVASHLTMRRPVAAPGDPRGGWRLRPDTTGFVDFAFENDVDRHASFQITQVLYVETAQDPDIAIFRIDENGPPPSALALDLTAHRSTGWTDAAIFAVGHPIADANDDRNVAVVFGRLDGTKRISPGKVTGLLGGVLTHDCSTTNGSSGSPLIDFATLKAVGLHYFGKPGDRNEAVFLPAIADHRAIVKSVAGGWST